MLVANADFEVIFYTTSSYGTLAWGMIVIADLSLESPRCAMLTPSILMQPPEPSMIRNKDKVIDDFPAPVLPTMPTFSDGFTQNVTPVSDSIKKFYF